MGNDRKTPPDPLPAAKRPRELTRPGGFQTATGNRPPPKLPIAREELGPPKRSLSPPPKEEPQPTSAEYGRRVAELGDTVEAERQRRHQAEARATALENELRAARAETTPQRQPEPKAPKVEVAEEAIVITRRGLSFPWGMAPWVIAALAGGWAAKGHIDQAAPSAKDVTATAAVAATKADQATADNSAAKTDLAKALAECRENDGYILDVIESLRTGLEVVRPPGLPERRPMSVDAPNASARAPLLVGGGKVKIAPAKK